MFLFHGNLNDFLLKKQKEQWIPLNLKRTTSLKDAIEAIGVPHVEVGSIAIGGVTKPLTALVHPADQVQVYPHLHPFPADAPVSFVLDVHLGKLARLLRLMGVDALYENNLDDPQIVAIAARQNRAVLTRDIGLLKHKVSAIWILVAITASGRAIAGGYQPVWALYPPSTLQSVYSLQ
jgi:hypothetical protein